MGKAKGKGPRRGNGEGSVYLDARGMWRGAVTMPNGRRRYFSAPTRAEASAKVGDAAAALRGGRLAPDGRVTVAAYLEGWLKESERRVLERTLRGYESAVRLHIVPVVGRVRLVQLSARHVVEVMGQMTRAGAAPSHVARVRSILSRALAEAVRTGALVRNVATLAPPPRQVEPERVWLDASQAAAFLAAAASDRDGPVLSLILLLGLRQGEAQGLRWDDYSAERGQIEIRRTVYKRGGEWIENAPKSAASRRTLPVPGPAAELLERERQRQALAEQLTAAGPIFLSRAGKPYGKDRLLLGLHRLLDAAGLPRIRMHDLRHSTASILLERGVSPRVVADLLGHSKIATTLGIYSHVTARLVTTATDAMGALMPPTAAPAAAPGPVDNPSKPAL